MIELEVSRVRPNAPGDHHPEREAVPVPGPEPRPARDRAHARPEGLDLHHEPVGVRCRNLRRVAPGYAYHELLSKRELHRASSPASVRWARVVNNVVDGQAHPVVVDIAAASLLGIAMAEKRGRARRDGDEVVLA